MAATITTSVVTGGTNSHATTVAEVNAFRSDFGLPGVVGTITLNAGSGGTGSFAVNAQGSPAMFVDVTAGTAYITATPSGQTSQLLRAYMASNSTSYVISSNASGSTKYDWIYLQVNPTNANNPASDASDVTALYTSRSSSNTADNGSPPTYGVLLAVVTVANGASSIANSAISDKRINASLQLTQSNTTFFDFVESGCIWSGDSYASTLNASMTSGFIWISGVRLSVSAVSARGFTASKDTYIDLSNNGDGTAAFTYTPVTNNAASPALAAGAIRIGIIITGASTIAAATSVNQGQETMILPIASSIPYAVTDSLGNLICPRDPQHKTLGYRQILSNFSGAANASAQDVTGLNVTFIPPSSRKIKATLMTNLFNSTNTNSVDSFIVESSTNLNAGKTNITSTNNPISPYNSYLTTPSAGAHTYKVQVAVPNSGTPGVEASSTEPAFILIELA